MSFQKTAVLGASTLAGREILERLRIRKIGVGELALTEPGAESAVISALADDLLLSTPRIDEALDGADLVIACLRLSEDDARAVRETVSRGALVLDVVGALGGRAFDAWAGATSGSLGPGIHAAPAASSLLVATLLRCARAAGATGAAAGIAFEPASEIGREALDELYQQSIAMLNFETLPTKVLGAAMAHDVHSPGWSGALVEERLRREISELLARPAPPLMVVRPGLFHGSAVAVHVDVDAAAWKAAIVTEGRMEMAPPDEPASPAAAARTESAVVGRIDADPAGGAWAWAAVDSLAFGAVGSVVELLARG